MSDGQRNMLIELKLYQSTPFFSSVLDGAGDGVVVSFTHRRLNPLAKRPRFPLNKRLVGQQNLFGRLGEN